MSAGLLARANATQPPVAPIREAVVAGLDDPGSYPTLSEAAVRAMAVVNGGDASINQLGAVIRPDAVVTAAVIRTANSWLYRGKGPVETVPAAVLRIGLRECGKVIASVGMGSLYHRLDPCARKGCEALHRHSVFVACLAGQLNATLGMGQSTAFTAGLLHDIGRIVLCGKMPGRFREANLLDFREDAESLGRERESFGIDHPAVGYRFATRNELPEPIVRAILNHHRADEERFHPELVGLIGTADVVANYVQREHRLTGLDLVDDPAFEALTRGWNCERVGLFHKVLPGAVRNAIREARGMVRSGD